MHKVYLKYFSHRFRVEICSAKCWLIVLQNFHFYEIGGLTKRLTSSQDSLYVQENIVIENGFEESAVKMISPFEYEISGPRDRARNVLSQN